jgi:uncharacterized membrane protein
VAALSDGDMGVLQWASERLLASVLLFVLFGSVLTVSLLGITGWIALVVLTGSGGALGSLLWLFVVATVVALPLTLVAGVLVAAGIAARASSAVSGDRAKQVASYLERESDAARAVGLASVVEKFDSRTPDERADDRIDRLKQRYVEGSLTDTEFERKIREVVDQENVDRSESSVIDDQLREGRRERERE